jgi:Rha family phage regulatory protein
MYPLDVSSEFRESNFGLSSYQSEQNKEMPEYLMTRDGFTILAMGYTGKS